MKLRGRYMDVYNMGYSYPILYYDDMVLYAGDLMTFDKQGLKKHYFVEGERFLTNCGSEGQAWIYPMESIEGIKPQNPEQMCTEFTHNIITYFAKHKPACYKFFDQKADISSELFGIAYRYSYLLRDYQKPESYYLHTDRLGSGSAVTDDRGEARHILSYMPYGETLLDLSQGGYETPYQFTGYEKDQETGLHYAEARYYDSRLSIFNSTDPMWYKYPHQSNYTYCNNNPLMYRDPTGRDGEITGNGTKEDPYVIHAAYYYKKGSLSEAEINGLNAAADAYNKAGMQKLKGNIYLKYNIEVNEVDDLSGIKEKTQFIDINGNIKSWGNRVKVFHSITGSSESTETYGSATNDYIGYFPENIKKGLEEGRNAYKFYKGIMIHEIGHNLGGEHSEYNDNSIMDQRGSINGFFIYPQIDRTLRKFTQDIFNIRDKHRPKESIDGRIWTRRK